MLKQKLDLFFTEKPGKESSFAFPLRSAETAHTTPQPGIEQIAQGVAKHVNAEDGDHQGQPRPEGESRIGLHVLTALPIEHPPPTLNFGHIFLGSIIACNGRSPFILNLLTFEIE